MRLLVFNLVTDADDPVLGFTSRWLTALAGRCESVDVITMRAGRLALPANVSVHSVGKEKGYSIPRRVFELERILLSVLRRRRPDACFSHMMPVFTVLGAPALIARGVPIVTWYAHPHRSAMLTLAHHASTRMVTSLEGAYPYRRDKLVVLGQGIDTDVFSPGTVAPPTPPVLLSAGRLSPVKDHPTILKAAGQLRREGVVFRLVLLGGPATPRDAPYVEQLRAQVSAEGLDAHVELPGPVPPDQVVGWYRQATAHVNATKSGSGDKVVLEAMSCGRPSLVANDGFRATLGAYADDLVFRYGDATDLAQRLRGLLARSADHRARMGETLRTGVVQLHSLDGLTDRLMAVLREVSANARGPGGR